MNEMAEKVVEMCFRPPNTISILNANTSSKELFKYCICKNDSGEDVVMCHNRKCKQGQWFHYSCKDVSQSESLADEWYCSKLCESSNTQNESESDSIYEFSRMLLWKGIGEKVRHRAIRSNNGRKMLSHWKEDMVQFFILTIPNTFYVVTG
ncbi:ING4 [Mytilus coruscus]|uniref:ING4 n=1 Tax=Mytilus coruscus TaxID=42192 RepID=A0A6J8BB15_MYTCO|nr:ING4 [Mytilus coruscus]